MNRARVGITALTLTAVVAGAGARSPAASRCESVEQTLRQIERESVDAAMRRDTGYLNRLLADGYVDTTAGGKVRTKGDVLADYRSGRLRVTALAVDDVKVRAYGDAAVVTGRSTIRGRTEDGDFNGTGRFTRVFARIDGRWQVVADQSTSVPQVVFRSGRLFGRQRR